ncbi:hypothetical protein PIB30_060198, partial [Stylosanthes scabra]|nr:hypothetical protein [Stylosanthes scabra]
LDQIGDNNPTCNNTFHFRITPEYLTSIISGFSIAINVVRTFNDHVIGTVRIMMSNILYNVELPMKPCFSAVQVCCQSGETTVGVERGRQGGGRWRCSATRFDVEGRETVLHQGSRTLQR